MSNVVTAAELAAMTPAQRQAHFDASVVTDLSQVPTSYLEVIRARLHERLGELDTVAAPSPQDSTSGA